MRNLARIIIHASDSDIESHDNIELIKIWHLQRGFRDVGYHFFITKNGDIQIGRPVGEIGSHCRSHNHDSIGICLSGRHHFTDQQFESLKTLCAGLRFQYAIGSNMIYPHNYFNKNKTCPNFDIEFLKSEQR